MLQVENNGLFAVGGAVSHADGTPNTAMKLSADDIAPTHLAFFDTGGDHGEYA